MSTEHLLSGPGIVPIGADKYMREQVILSLALRKPKFHGQIKIWNPKYYDKYYAKSLVGGNVLGRG